MATINTGSPYIKPPGFTQTTTPGGGTAYRDPATGTLYIETAPGVFNPAPRTLEAPVSRGSAYTQQVQTQRNYIDPRNIIAAAEQAGYDMNDLIAQGYAGTDDGWNRLADRLISEGVLSGSGQPIARNQQGSGLLGEYERIMQMFQDQGLQINPNIQITEAQAAEFMAQAQREISPYYTSQAKIAKDTLLQSLGYTTEDILQKEQEQEKKYQNDLRTIGEQAAEQGFAQSGRRSLTEQNLAEQTQRDIDARRRELSFKGRQLGSEFAQQYGIQDLSIPNIENAPRALPGQPNFQRPGGSSPFYTLSPDVYSGLVGTRQFEERGATRRYASELEEAFRQRGSSRQLGQIAT